MKPKQVSFSTSFGRLLKILTTQKQHFSISNVDQILFPLSSIFFYIVPLVSDWNGLPKLNRLLAVCWDTAESSRGGLGYASRQSGIAQIPMPKNLSLSAASISLSSACSFLLLLGDDVSHNVYVVASWHGLTAFARPRHPPSSPVAVYIYVHSPRLLRSYVARDNITVTCV